jgi:hypothetical protein
VTQAHTTQEFDGQTVPGTYLLWREQLAFMEVGIKGGLISTLISGLMLPFSIAVVQQLLPIFGTFEPTLLDKLFAVVLGVSFQLCYNIWMAVNLSTSYIGIWCKKAIKAIYGGLLVGTIVAVLNLFVLYHWLYFNIIPDWLARFNVKTGISHVLLVSAWMMPVLAVFTAVVSSAIFFYGARRAGRNAGG